MLIPMRVSLLTVGLSSIALSQAVTGCHSKESVSAVSAPPSAAASPAANAGEPRRFGSPISPGTAVALSSVMEKPDAFQDQSLIVDAKVRRNCTRRGCWMEIADGSADAPGCRVTFKDYGFFVPLDSAGSKARVQGTVQVRVVPGPEVEHLESEGAKFANKQADGSAREVRMVATGVELWREPT
jgi:hypothetical protein